MLLFSHLPRPRMPAAAQVAELHLRSFVIPPPNHNPNQRMCFFESPWGPHRSWETLKSQKPRLRVQASSSSARYAILGAGFAGLSVAWHLLECSSKESRIRIDIYDEVGIGGGASGVSGGLVHPYSPKVKLLWRGADCWNEFLRLLTIAERARAAKRPDMVARDSCFSFDDPIVCRRFFRWFMADLYQSLPSRGILRPTTNEKHMQIIKENAQSFLDNCNLELLDGDAAQTLVPELHLPLNSAVYMPLAFTIYPKRYLQALFFGCQNVADELSATFCREREINLFKEPVSSLHELAGHYDAVIICLGAKADMLPELSGKLPLRKCRGVVLQLRLTSDAREEYAENNPSILSDAWLAFQGPRSLLMGSTWDWSSDNHSCGVSEEEAVNAVADLLPKASAVYPAIRDWNFVGAKAGLRAMPPLTTLGSLPLLGCVDDAVKEKRNKCMYWLIGGLGSRGLLYHGLLGKVMAQAVISSNEDAIPPEFTSWKKKMNVWKDNL